MNVLWVRHIYCFTQQQTLVTTFIVDVYDAKQTNFGALFVVFNLPLSCHRTNIRLCNQLLKKTLMFRTPLELPVLPKQCISVEKIAFLVEKYFTTSKKFRPEPQESAHFPPKEI